MKRERLRAIFALVFCAVLLTMLLTACTVQKPIAAPSDTAVSPQSPSPSQPSESAEPSPSSAQESAGAAFKFEEKTFSKGGISIKYPQIVEAPDTAKAEQLNKLLADSALRDLQIIENDQDLDVYELSGTVSTPGPRVISVFFEGYANYKMAAHPYQFMYTVTIDAEKLQTVSLSQLINISEKFIPVLIDGTYSATGCEITDEIREQIRDFLDDFDAEHWVAELKKADQEGAYTFSYLTPDALVISVSAPHVMGDHIEISILYGDLDEFRTDHPVWDALLGAPAP